MARYSQAGSYPLNHRSKIQGERDPAASVREAEISGVGIAAGAMILGTVLSHQSGASTNREEQLVNPFASVESEPARSPSPGSPTAGEHISQTATTAPSEQVDVPGHEGLDFLAITPSLSEADHRQVPAETQSDTRSIEGRDGGLAAHAMSGSLLSGPGDATHGAVIADHTLNEISSTFSVAVSHLFEAVSGPWGEAAGLINHAASSVSQSLTGMLGNLSATIGDFTHTLSAPFLAVLDNPVEINNPALNLVDELHGAGSPAVELASSASPVTALLGSIAADGVVAETLGPSSAIAEMHPSVTSFGEIAQSVNINFVGQPFGHMIEPHDISTHGLGSILHGFV